MGKTIAILGGGTGGIVAARVLRDLLDEKHRVVVIDRNERHIFQANYPMLMVGLRRPDELHRSLVDLTKKGIDFIQAEVEEIVIEQNVVVTSKGSLSYDYLIIALGAQQHLETVPGQLELAYNAYNYNSLIKLQAKLQQFRQGRIVFFMASTPFTGAVGPYESVLLLDSYFRKRNIRHQVRLTYVTGEVVPFPAAQRSTGIMMRRLMAKRGIEQINEAKILSCDLEQRALILDGGLKVHGDIFIGIPSHWGPQVVRNSGLVLDQGWIKVDQNSLMTSKNNVFAVGDNAAIRLNGTRGWAPKAGVFAHYQAEVVARNIALQISGKKPVFRYTGKAIGAVLLTSHNQGMIIRINTYAPEGMTLSLSQPTKLGYVAKTFWEKYWLNLWL